jgi:hypothetical protein
MPNRAPIIPTKYIAFGLFSTKAAGYGEKVDF